MGNNFHLYTFFKLEPSKLINQVALERFLPPYSVSRACELVVRIDIPHLWHHPYRPLTAVVVEDCHHCL